jgi:hypothetical protein
MKATEETLLHSDQIRKQKAMFGHDIIHPPAILFVLSRSIHLPSFYLLPAKFSYVRDMNPQCSEFTEVLFKYNFSGVVMRFVSILIGLFIIPITLSAQTAAPIVPGNFTLSGTAMGAIQPPFTESSVYGRNAVPFSQAKTAVGVRDTLDDHFKRSSAFTLYTYTSGTSTFPVVGSNSLYLFVGEKFPFSGSATVLGILFACNQMRISDPPDTLGANLWAGNTTSGLPTGSSLTFGTFTMDKVDTNRTRPVFTYVAMNTPTQVTGPFVTTIQTRRLTTHDDLFVIHSNTQGDGRGEKRACVITPVNNQLTAMDLDHVGLSIGGQPLDFDVMIMPVIELTSTAADNPGAVIDGLELRGIAPQPASSLAAVSLRALQATQVTIDIMDIHGRLVTNTMTRHLTEGNHVLPLPVSLLPSGSYFVRIAHDRGAFAVPLRVAR